MELKFVSENIDELVNIINTLELSNKSNFQTASKLIRMYEILSGGEVINSKEVSDGKDV